MMKIDDSRGAIFRGTGPELIPTKTISVPFEVVKGRLYTRDTDKVVENGTVIPVISGIFFS
jgi:hypothetical protein